MAKLSETQAEILVAALNNEWNVPKAWEGFDLDLFWFVDEGLLSEDFHCLFLTEKGVRVAQSFVRLRNYIESRES